MKQNNINNYIYNSKTSILTLFRVVFFGAVGWGGGGGGGVQNGPYLKSAIHILQ